MALHRLKSLPAALCFASLLFLGLSLRVSADGKGQPNPKRLHPPFVEVGPTIDVHAGVQSIESKCTTLRMYGVNELRMGLAVIKNGEETTIEERSYQWVKWPRMPLPPDGKFPDSAFQMKGLVQAQFQPDQNKMSFSILLGGGVESHDGWDHLKKPKQIVAQGKPQTTYYREGKKSAGESHIARIDVIPDPTEKQVDLGEVKTLAKVKELSKQTPRTTYIVTTLHWTAFK
jgi:hypothetical protein